MAADYDPSSRISRPEFPQITQGLSQSREAPQRLQRGKGKGKGYHRPDARSGGLDDFILPEMTVDPWINLYHRLSPDVRERETKHLTPLEKNSVEDNVRDNQSAKRRPNVDHLNSV